MHFAQISLAPQVICTALIDFPFLVRVLALCQPQVHSPCHHIYVDEGQQCCRAAPHQPHSCPGWVAAPQPASKHCTASAHAAPQ